MNDTTLNLLNTADILIDNKGKKKRKGEYKEYTSVESKPVIAVYDQYCFFFYHPPQFVLVSNKS